jgi:hypothetical protein
MDSIATSGDMMVVLDIVNVSIVNRFVSIATSSEVVMDIVD